MTEAAVRASGSRGGRILLLTAAAAALLVATSSCDPCTGVVSCRSGLHVSATGRLIVHESGRPVEGVELEFTRSGGAPLEESTTLVHTDGDGRFVFRAVALEPGTSILDVEVRPPGRPAYRVEDVRLRTRTARGDGTDLGRWVVDPYYAYQAELRMRYGGGAPRLVGGRGARVVFRPTGGVPVDEDSLMTFTEASGRFLLLPDAEGAGRIVGELTVTHRDLESPYTIEALTIESEHVDRPLDLNAVLGLGPSLAYFGELFVRSAGRRIPAEDGRVTFRRTGGIAIEPDTFTVEAQPWGGFFFDPRPRGQGEVVGELILRPGGGRDPDTIPEVRMETFNADSLRLLGRWALGQQINYVGEVFIRSAGERIGAADVPVHVRRTGGIDVEPDSFTVRTTSWGAFPIQLHTDQEGTLVVDVEVELEPPRGPVRIEGLELETFAADSLRLAGRWAFGPQINYGAALVREDTGEGIGGVDVQFRRTGGIAVEPDTFTVTTQPWGGFALQAHTDEEGALEGELLVHLPVPRGPVLIEGLRLETFRTDEFSFLQYFEL